MERGSNKLLIIFAIIYFSLTFFTIVITIGVLASRVWNSGRNEIFQRKSNIYMFSNFNSETNSTSTREVNINKILKKDDEFLTYRKEGGSFSTISHFCDNQYECSGSCICDENRRNVLVVSKHIYFAIFAISSLVAVNIASKFFEEECKIQYSDECETNVKHEIEECKIKEEIKEDERWEFYCEGYCIGKKLNNEKSKELLESFDCQAHTISRKYTLHISELPDYYSADAAARNVLFVRQKFQKEELSPFCKIVSKSTVYYSYWHFGKNSKMKKNISLCTGQTNFGKYKYHSNIGCQRIR